MILSQWLAFGVLLLMLVGLATLFATRGVKIKLDPENKPPTDLGGGQSMV